MKKVNGRTALPTLVQTNVEETDVGAMKIDLVRTAPPQLAMSNGEETDMQKVGVNGAPSVTTEQCGKKEWKEDLGIVVDEVEEHVDEYDAERDDGDAVSVGGGGGGDGSDGDDVDDNGRTGPNHGDITRTAGPHGKETEQKSEAEDKRAVSGQNPVSQALGKHEYVPPFLIKNGTIVPKDTKTETKASGETDMFVSDEEEEAEYEPDPESTPESVPELVENGKRKRANEAANDITVIIEEKIEPDDKSEEDLGRIGKEVLKNPTPLLKNSPKKSPSKDQANASSRHKSSNVVLTNLVTKTMKDLKEFDNLGVGLDTPEKMVKPKKLASEANQRSELKRSTRSRSQPRPKELTEEADVQTP